MQDNTWKNYTKQLKIGGEVFSKKRLIELDISGLYDWQIQNFKFVKEWLSDKDYIIVKTSGTTGKPKNIKLHKNTLVQSAINTGKALGLSKNNTSMLCLPSKYIAGKMMIVRAFVLGLDLICVQPTSVPEIDKNIDFCAMTPMQVQGVIKQDIEKLSKIKTLIIGGAKVSRELKKILQSLPVKVYETYGMTETATHIALKSVNGKNKSDYFQILSSSTRIDVDDRNCLTIDSSELGVRKLYTNDIVEIIDETHFKWLGRLDNVINSGGIKLIPEEIEEKINSIIDTDFFVFPIEDQILGNALAIVIENTSSDAEIPFHLVLNRYQIPKKIYYLDSFCRTENGKIDRKTTISRLF